MLRASVNHHNSDIQPDRIVGGAEECGIEHAKEIFALTDAVVLRDTAEYPDARIRAELRVGRDATDRLVMVAANFQQMNRMMDACANLAVWISNTSPTGSPSPTS